MVRHIVPDVHWLGLMAEGAGEAHVYESEEQAKAAVDPHRHEAQWLPNDKNYLRSLIGAFADSGELIGSIALYQREDDGVGVLEGLYVRESARCHGHGTRLVRVALEDARDWRIQTIEIFTIEGDKRAFDFWRKRLKQSSNAESSVTFTEFPSKRAIGWRLNVNEIEV